MPVKSVVSTDEAPAAIGPYSQAILAGGLVFVSGQIPLDPVSGTMVAGGVAAQTTRVLESITAILTAAGSSLEQVVKTTIYLTDLGDFTEVNTAYERFFTVSPPARATVQVAALPRGAGVEIDAVALAGRD